MPWKPKHAKSLLDYVARFRRLNVHRSGDHSSPHKPALLLAVIDAVEAQQTPVNEFEFNELLRERFLGYFKIVRTDRDHANPHYPFFHLRSEGFWHHRARPGRESALNSLREASKPSDVTENIQFVTLDSELFEAIETREGRRELRATLIHEYFPWCADRIWDQVGREEAVGSAQLQIEKIPDMTEGSDADVLEAFAREYRDAAFRRVVVPAYDYRCAACGLRIVVDGSAVVEACHLIPWEVRHDDDPRNGLALCRNHHWSMDQTLIAPGPDFKWHASSTLDPRIDGQRQLVDLDGENLISPLKSAYKPREDALRFRLERLKAG
jgi:putative restriction endonuclease